MKIRSLMILSNLQSLMMQSIIVSYFNIQAPKLLLDVTCLFCIVQISHSTVTILDRYSQSFLFQYQTPSHILYCRNIRQLFTICPVQISDT